jgi:oligopeptide/dipeptide ABC transporter ATP-binding protein
MANLLEVTDLSVDFTSREGTVRAVDQVSFVLRSGERLGLVGESGAGKSVVARALLGLTKAPGKVTSGTAMFDGRDILRLSRGELNRVRGRRIAMIPQDASLALNPTLTVADHAYEVLRQHTDLTKQKMRERTVVTLDRVGLADPARVLGAHASELSGGMKQRVAIALALLCGPEIIVADDPTSAVDVTLQAQILSDLCDLTERLGVAMLFISHDLRVVASLCSRVVVLYAGQVAEVGAPRDLLGHTRHPYSRALISCLPSVDERLMPLPVVPGAPPEHNDISGCRFHPRCPNALPQCSETRPPLSDKERGFACWNPL